MIKKIKNKSVHIITLKAGFIMPHKTETIEITEKEAERFADKIEYEGKVVDTVSDTVVEPIIPEEKVKKEVKEIKKGIINEYIVDNYMKANTRGMLNDLEEDKEKLTLEDLDLLYKYESENKNRQKVLDKIKTINEE